MKTIDLNIDNATLVQECRSGDQDAMSILYTRFAPRMLRVISRYVQDIDSAHDILHDGFIAAFTRLDTLREPERLDFWLATIMKNLSLKFLQAQSVSSILEEIPETTDEDDPIEALDFATLESLIRQLPEGYQKVFRLAVLEGKSHKEISEILGIAPNSSSSQLFHAKLRLRQLIRDYQLSAGLISLLLVIASIGLLLLFRHTTEISTRNYLSAEALRLKSDSESTDSPGISSDSISNAASPSSMAVAAALHSVYTQTAEPMPFKSQSNDTVPDSIVPASTFRKTDTVSSRPVQPLEANYDSFYDRLFTEVPRNNRYGKGWSAGIMLDPGLLSFNSGDKEFFAADNPSFNDPCRPPTNPDDNDENPTTRAMARSAATGIESYLASASRRHHLPISFALTAEKHLTSWLGLESGVGYAYLHTDFERYPSDRSTCHWHYVEIPLKVNLYAYSSPSFRLYAGVGGKLSIPVFSYANVVSNPYCRSGRFASSPVWSVSAGVGAAIRLSRRIDLFLEPSLHYLFPQEAAIPNMWTDDQPFSFSIPLGIRLSW